MIEKGTKIRVPKGTAIRTTHPRCGHKTAAKTYVVTVDHVLDATSINVAHRSYDADGNLTYESEPRIWHGDARLVFNRYGTKDLEALRKHFVEGERRYRPNGSSYCTLYLQVLEAEVSWAGTGGYWFRAPISTIEVFDGRSN